MAATFGRNGISPSYAQFSVPNSVRDDLAYNTHVSCLVRTRQQSGLIFFIGADPSVAESNQTFMTIELSQVGVVSKIKAGDEIQTNVLPGLIADGSQHRISVNRNYSFLQIQLDSTSLVFAVNYSVPVIPDVLYVGGMPSVNSVHRRRRATDSNDANQFSGTMQDVQLNDVRLQSFPLNDTDEDGTPAPSVELPINLLNVDVGEQSDDVCQLLQPCQNNATCHNVFYNKYRLRIHLCCYHV